MNPSDSSFAEALNGLMRHMQAAGGMLATMPKPYEPVCVLYFGEQSARFHQDIHRALTSAWGTKAANVVLHLAINDPMRFHADVVNDDKQAQANMVSLHGDGSAEPTSLHGFGLGMQRMMAASGVFARGAMCQLYCVLDTASINEEAFHAWHALIDDVRQALAGVSLQTMLITLLHDDVGADNVAVETALRDCLDDNRYDCMVVYGNHFFAGGFNNLFDDAYITQEHTDRDIIGNLILLTDTDDADLHQIRSIVYSQAYLALTASMRIVEKPNKAIAITLLHEMLQRLVSYIGANNGKLSANDLEMSFGTPEGKRLFQTIDEAINAVMGQYAGFLQWLPRPESEHAADLAQRSYADANQLSMGCLDAFVQQHHIPAFLDQIEALKFHDDLQAVLGAIPAYKFIAMTDRDVEEVVDAYFAQITSPSDVRMRSVVGVAIQQRMRMHAYATLRQEMSAMLQTLRGQAAATMQVCNGITAQVTGEFAGTDPSIIKYYSNVIARIWNSDTDAALSAAVLHIGNDASTMWNIFVSWIADVMDQNATIFQSDFMTELVQRTTAAGGGAMGTKEIGKSLVSGLDKRIGLHTLTPIDANGVMESYLMHDDGVFGSPSNQLHAFLSKHPLAPGVSRAFVNAPWQDHATTMRFHPVDASHF